MAVWFAVAERELGDQWQWTDGVMYRHPTCTARHEKDFCVLARKSMFARSDTHAAMQPAAYVGYRNADRDDGSRAAWLPHRRV